MEAVLAQGSLSFFSLLSVWCHCFDLLKRITMFSTNWRDKVFISVLCFSHFHCFFKKLFDLLTPIRVLKWDWKANLASYSPTQWLSSTNLIASFYPGPPCYLHMSSASVVEFSIGKNFKGSMCLHCILQEQVQTFEVNFKQRT